MGESVGGWRVFSYFEFLTQFGFRLPDFSSFFRNQEK